MDLRPLTTIGWLTVAHNEDGISLTVENTFGQLVPQCTDPDSILSFNKLFMGHLMDREWLLREKATVAFQAHIM